MQSYDVIFEATSFTDNQELVDAELSAAFLDSYNEVSIKEGNIPIGVLRVVSAHIAADENKNSTDIHLYLSVALQIEVARPEDAWDYEAPVDLLTKLMDELVNQHSATNSLQIDGDWEVLDVSESNDNYSISAILANEFISLAGSIDR